MLKFQKKLKKMEQKIIQIGYGKVNKVKVGKNLPLAFFGGHALLNRKTILFLWLKL